MANPEHLAILKQGVSVWNEWRVDNPLLDPDLSETDFRDHLPCQFSHWLYLPHNSEMQEMYEAISRGTATRDPAWRNGWYVDLTSVDFSRTILSRCNLEGARLNGADLKSADLMGAT